MSTALRDRFVKGEGPALLFLAFVAVLLFAPFLFFGAMNGGDEIIGAHYQYNFFYSEAIQQGKSFLWNPYSFAGFPTYVNGFGTFLSPITYAAFRLLPAFAALYFLVTLVIFGGLAFSYLTARALSLSRLASLLVGFAYGSADIFQLSLPLSTAHTFFVLPFLFYALCKASQANTKKLFALYVLLGGAGIGLGFLAAYLQIFIYILVLVGCFALFLDWRGFESRLPFSGKALGALALMFGIGLIIGLPQLVSLAAYAPFTARSAHYAAEIIPQSGIHLGDVATFFVPHGIQLPLGASSAPLYFGLIGFFCILVALLFVRSLPVFFFAGLYLFLIGLAANLPGFDWVNLHVPPFNRIGAIHRWLLPGALLPALLAGYGFEQLLVLRTQLNFNRFFKFFTWVTLIGLALLATAQYLFELVIRTDQLKQSLLEYGVKAAGRTLESLPHTRSYYITEIDHMLKFLQHAVSFSNPWFSSFLISTLLSLLALHLYIRFPRERVMGGVLLTAAFFTLCVVYAGEEMPSTISRSVYLKEVPPVASIMLNRARSFDDNRYLLMGGELLGRALSGREGEPPTEEEVVLAMRNLLIHEVGTQYGLAAINGFEAIRSQRQNLLISTVFSTRTDLVLDLDKVKAGAPINRSNNTEILTKVSPEEKASDIVKRLPLLSMMNVKYIISLYPLKSPQLTSLASYHMDSPRLDYTVYENRSVLPRLYFASRPVFWDGSERDLFLAMLDTKDFSKQTYIECADCTTTQSRTSKVEVTHTENGVVEARVSSSAGGWLVYSESNLPGWIAEIDGTRVPIKTANYLFQAIQVPAGEHTVAFRYVGSFELFLERLPL